MSGLITSSAESTTSIDRLIVITCTMPDLPRVHTWNRTACAPQGGGPRSCSLKGGPEWLEKLQPLCTSPRNSSSLLKPPVIQTGGCTCRPSVGVHTWSACPLATREGETIRISTPRITGAALIDMGEVVHMSAFRSEESDGSSEGGPNTGDPSVPMARWSLRRWFRG